MARVTVEDCVTKIPNRFELVMLAAQRARGISSGVPLTLDRDNDKNPVVALREIADDAVVLGDLESSLVKGLQRYVEQDDPLVEDEMDALSLQQDLGAQEFEPTQEAEPMQEAQAAEDAAAAEGEDVVAEESEDAVAEESEVAVAEESEDVVAEQSEDIVAEEGEDAADIMDTLPETGEGAEPIKA